MTRQESMTEALRIHNEYRKSHTTRTARAAEPFARWFSCLNSATFRTEADFLAALNDATLLLVA